MACLLSSKCNLPAHILLRIIVYLDDVALLAFFKVCYHIIGPVSRDKIDWKNWFAKKFSDTLETGIWQRWHDSILAKENRATKSRSSEIQSNGNWLRHCIARLDLTLNWQKNVTSSHTLYITEDKPDEDMRQINARIIASCIYGTLVLTDIYTLYLVEHYSKPKISFIANISEYFSDQSYIHINGELNQQFIVLTGPKRAESDESADDTVVYWNRMESESMESKVLKYNGGATKIVELWGRWLLLKEPNVSTEAYPISIFKLDEPVPIRITSTADWNTYGIGNSYLETCDIYAGYLGFSDNDNEAIYKWTTLKSTMLDVHNTNNDRSISIPLRISECGSRHSRFIDWSILLVWQYIPVINNSTLFAKDSNNNHDNNVVDEPFDDLQNIFFIHNEDNDNLYYSGTFTSHLPDVAIKQKRIIILNDNNLKLIDIESNDIVFDTMIAPDLTYVGFVLDRFWITQHPVGGFYAMDIMNSGKFGRISCKYASSKEVTANTNMLIKVINNKIILWTMHQVI